MVDIDIDFPNFNYLMIIVFKNMPVAWENGNSSAMNCYEEPPTSAGGSSSLDGKSDIFRSIFGP